MSQSQISRTLRDETAVARIASILSQERFDSRSALGRRICEEFSFVDARGRPQLAGCMKALGALAERVPDIVLPPPKASAVERRPRLLNTDVPEPEGVPAHPTRIRDLGITAVAHAADRALWNTLIAREHPHGMTTFAGCQVRYLVGSAHGWLGAAGFAAAALRAAARERWIGWDDAGRRGHLQRVVCLSRFLIRPSVRCPHLASHVLGRILRRLPGDFEERYGFRPYLVESFADEGYNGTCLRAANFLCVGRTAGRGRQDREQRRAQTVKRASEPNHCTLTTVTRLSARTPRTAALARRSSSFMLSSCSFIASVESGLLREIIRHLHDADVRSEHDSHGKMTVRHGQAFGQ